MEWWESLQILSRTFVGIDYGKIALHLDKADKLPKIDLHNIISIFDTQYVAVWQAWGAPPILQVGLSSWLPLILSLLAFWHFVQFLRNNNLLLLIGLHYHMTCLFKLVHLHNLLQNGKTNMYHAFYPSILSTIW